MQTRRLTEGVFVSPQLSPEDVQALAAMGFKAIIDNRPDDEAPGQPNAASIEAEADRLGLAFRHIPVETGHLSESEVAAFGEALASVEGPVLAYCKSGARSTVLWALSQASTLKADEILECASGAGFQLEALRPALEARARAVRS